MNETMTVSVSSVEDLDSTGRVILESGKWCKTFYSDEQPRMKGKWAGKGDSEGFGIFICDACGKFAMMKSNFCPNCGADMREEVMIKA